MTVWFVLSAKLEGVDDNGTRRQIAVHNNIFDDRPSALVLGMFADKCKSLPNVFKPLVASLEAMRTDLVAAYETYEQSFDGARIAKIGPKFMVHLARLYSIPMDGKISVTRVTLDRPNQYEFNVQEGTTVSEEEEGEEEDCKMDTDEGVPSISYIFRVCRDPVCRTLVLERYSLRP